MSQSFLHLLQAYGDAYPSRITYSPGAAFRAWRERFLAAVRGLLSEAPPWVPLAVETVERKNLSDHTRLDLRNAVSTCVSLPAYRLMPKNIARGERWLGREGHVEHEPLSGAIAEVAGLRDPVPTGLAPHRRCAGHLRVDRAAAADAHGHLG